jgi:multimeric flavodoxin WrbA
MGKKVVAILGTYRRGETIETAVDAMLEGARSKGATTHAIRLIDRRIEFCSNCRQCTQTAGPARGKCRQEDDLESIVAEIEAADAVVLATPVNCGNATALFRRFMERLIGNTYWPWGQPAPRARSRVHTLKAALVASSAMPGMMIPLLTGTGTALRTSARLLGAKPVASLWIGLAAGEPHHELSARTLSRARRIGMGLV